MHTFLLVGLTHCHCSMDMMMDGKKMPPLSPDNPLLQGFIKMCPGGNPAEGVNLQLTAATPSPRIIKTHLPLSLLHPSLLDTVKVTCTPIGSLSLDSEYSKTRLNADFLISLIYLAIIKRVSVMLFHLRQVVYVARNPRDVVVSLYHHCRLLKTLDYSGSLEQFVKYFVEDNGEDWIMIFTMPSLRSSDSNESVSALHNIFFDTSYFYEIHDKINEKGKT